MHVCFAGAADAALLQVWLPFAVGWKRLWWESVAVPEDVDDEQAFRAQLRCVCMCVRVCECVSVCACVCVFVAPSAIKAQ